MLYLNENRAQRNNILQKIKEKQSGQIAIVSIVIVVVIGLIVASGISLMVSAEFKMTDNAVKSDMVFYSTEGALMDMLVRIKKDTNWPSIPYSDSLTLNDVTVEREVSGNNDFKTIDVIGENKAITKHLRATYNTLTGDYTIIEIEPE